ncbi:MAG: hypothetical protein EXR98_08470 [Gemmataceae bacterium]|nr:hypothetical protein [Gemmataceae bacterium]
MSLQKITLALIALIVPLSLVAGEPVKLREIDAKGIKVDFAKGRVGIPKLIANADELDKLIPDTQAIKKQVDFSKEKLVLFAWGGSGQDQLSAKLSDDGKAATFSYTAGRTRDFRHHVHLFVLPKNTQYKIEGVAK